jgi:serine palmitoyltransferase
VSERFDGERFTSRIREGLHGGPAWTVSEFFTCFPFRCSCYRRPVGKKVLIEGKEVLNFASYDFLGMANDRKFEKAAIDIIRTYGIGTCGPRGFYGTIDVHLDLEKSIAEFLGTESAIIYSYGFSTVASAIPAFSKKGDVLIV